MLTTTPPNSIEFYRGAIWYPIEPVPTAPQGNLADKNQITCHITEGGPNVINTLGWYANLTAKQNCFGAHFYIGQDGTIYQTALIGAITWHASQVNRHSIGIEHAAASGTDPHVPSLPVTAAQYAASAKLIKWIATMAKFPVDRNHIRGHNEASPADKHIGCCTPTLNLDNLVALASAVQ